MNKVYILFLELNHFKACEEFDFKIRHNQLSNEQMSSWLWHHNQIILLHVSFLVLKSVIIRWASEWVHDYDITVIISLKHVSFFWFQKTGIISWVMSVWVHGYDITINPFKACELFWFQNQAQSAERVISQWVHGYDITIIWIQNGLCCSSATIYGLDRLRTEWKLNESFTSLNA